MVRLVGAFATLTVTEGETELRKKLSPEYVAPSKMGLRVSGVMTAELVMETPVESPIAPVTGNPDCSSVRFPVKGIGEVTVPFVCTVVDTVNGTPACALEIAERLTEGVLLTTGKDPNAVAASLAVSPE